jgi:hypothetical protein
MQAQHSASPGDLSLSFRFISSFDIYTHIQFLSTFYSFGSIFSLPFLSFVFGFFLLARYTGDEGVAMLEGGHME